MNDGRVSGRQVLPASALKQTLAPSIALPNTELEVRGYGELLNSAYGMGRWTASYRGHLLAFHGDANGREEFESGCNVEAPQDLADGVAAAGGVPKDR